MVAVLGPAGVACVEIPPSPSPDPTSRLAVSGERGHLAPSNGFAACRAWSWPILVRGEAHASCILSYAGCRATL